MTEGIKAFLCRVFRVPSQPDPPPGDAESLRVFRAGRNYFRYKLLLWAFAHFVIVLALTVMFGLILANAPEDSGLRTAATGIGLLVAAFVLFELFVSYFVLRLDFEMRWYIVTGRSLRIREGILSVQEKTITFANIQNMTVRQGPVQRLLGLADLAVSTAGGGGSDPHGHKGIGDDLHVGYFRGVDNVDEIRRQVESGVRRHRGAGLGDSDDRDRPEMQPGTAAVEAAQRVLDEVRALRNFLAPPP